MLDRVLGTVAVMAEQVRGRQVDARAVDLGQRLAGRGDGGQLRQRQLRRLGGLIAPA